MPTFDGENLIITLDAVVDGVLNMDWGDTYSAWKDWSREGTNLKYPQAFITTGGDPINTILNSGSYYFLRNALGWRIRPYENDGTYYVVGNLTGEDANYPLFTETIGNYTVGILGLQPVTQAISADIIAQSVWDEPIADHLIGGSTGRSVGVTQFDGVVTLSSTGTSGTTFPIGTANSPVNNITDAITIADNNGIDIFHFENNFTITGGTYSGYTFTGRGRKAPDLTFDGTTLNGCQFREIELKGTVTDASVLGANFCTFNNFTGATITAYECIFIGDIYLGSGETNLYTCVDGVPGIGIPNIHVGLCDSLGIWNWNGGIQISDIITPDTAITCMISEGRLWVDSTCVEGDIIVKGNADLRGTTGGTTIDSEGLMTADTIAEYTWKASTKDIAVSPNGLPGIEYPQGRPGVPISNMTDAKLLGDELGIHTYNIHEAISFEEDVADSVFLGHTAVTHDVITIAGYSVSGCKFTYLSIIGDFGAASADNDYIDSLITNVTNISGTANNSGIIGTIGLGGAGSIFSTTACFLAGDVTFNFIAASTLQSHYISGQAIITNMPAGAVALITADTTGNLTIDASCTGGTIVVRGSTNIINNSPSVTIVDQTASITNISEAVWNSSDGITATEILTFLQKVIKNKREITPGKSLVVYDDDELTAILSKTLVDKDGNSISDLVVGGLAGEGATSV